MGYVFYVYVYIFYYFLCVLRVFFSFLFRVRMCVCVSRHILRLDFVCCCQLIAVVGVLLPYCPAQCEALLVVIALRCTVLTKTKRKWRKSNWQTLVRVVKCCLRCRLGLREGYGVLSGVPDPPLKGTIFVGQHLSAIVKCREYAASAVHKQNRGSRCRLVCGLEWAQARMHYMGVHTVATWRIRLSDPCAAMQLCVRLLYLFILFI